MQDNLENVKSAAAKWILVIAPGWEASEKLLKWIVLFQSDGNVLQLKLRLHNTVNVLNANRCLLRNGYLKKNCMCVCKCGCRLHTYHRGQKITFQESVFSFHNGDERTDLSGHQVLYTLQTFYSLSHFAGPKMAMTIVTKEAKTSPELSLYFKDKK